MLPSEPIDVDRFWPPRDRTGLIIPHKFEVPLLLRAVPSVMGLFTGEVPPEFYSETMEGERPEIVIACPCGEEPTLRFGLRSFSIAACACGRIFLHDGQKVRVGRDDS